MWSYGLCIDLLIFNGGQLKVVVEVVCVCFEVVLVNW